MATSDLNPYEILNVSATASLKDISTAYKVAIRAGKYPPPVLARAFQELRMPRARAEHDLFTLSLDEPTDPLKSSQSEGTELFDHAVGCFRPDTRLVTRIIPREEDLEHIASDPDDLPTLEFVWPTARSMQTVAFPPGELPD